MTDFRFYHPLEIRYGDLDPQGHVNNARYLTYFEQARISYIRHLGLWKQGSFLDIGIILANAQLTFLAPVQFGQQVKAGVAATRLGTKSLTMEYQLQDSQTGLVLCTGSSVLVAYDYRLSHTVSIPPDWRQAICAFESLEPSECE